jgi:hypothetical protein
LTSTSRPVIAQVPEEDHSTYDYHCLTSIRQFFVLFFRVSVGIPSEKNKKSLTLKLKSLLSLGKKKNLTKDMLQTPAIKSQNPALFNESSIQALVFYIPF